MEIKAMMSGSVFRVLVQEGDMVNEGDPLIILESMKMEIPIESSSFGVVEEVRCCEGDFVQEGDVVVVIR